MVFELFPCALPARLAEPLAITHVTVVPMDSERLLHDQSVIISDGVIMALGPSSEIETGVIRCLDGSGKYLLPGLADMHVHYNDPGHFALFLENGVTRVRNMWGKAPVLALQQVVRRGEWPGPHIVTTSPIIDGSWNGQPFWPGSQVLNDPAEAEALVRGYAERGYQQIKVYSSLAPEVLRALGAAAHAVGLRMVGHCPNAMTYEEAIAAGMTCFEHFSAIENGHLLPGDEDSAWEHGWADHIISTCNRLDEAALRRLARHCAAQQIWNCPTVIVRRQMGLTAEEAAALPWLRYEPAAQRMAWLPTNDRRFAKRNVSEAERLAAMNALYESRLLVTRIFYEEGAPLLAGTDTPNPYVVQGFSLHQELAELVRAGLSPFAALRCATSEAARFLDESGKWGTIAVGKQADLLLLNDNPLANVAAAQPEAVFVNGWHLTRADLDALLEWRAALVQPERGLPPVTQSSTSALAQDVSMGSWRERWNDDIVGRLRSRLQRLPGGRLRIEECRSSFYFARGRQEIQRFTLRLLLAANGCIESLEMQGETLAGTETHDLTRTGHERYRLHHCAVDGWETDEEIAAATLIPAETLALTALPALIEAGQLTEGSYAALDLAPRGILRTTLTLTKSAEHVWTASLADAYGQRTISYQFADDGKLTSIRAGTVGVWEMEAKES